MSPSEQSNTVNPMQPSGELVYNRFSIVHLQIFDIGNIDFTCLEDKNYFDATPDPIDEDIFLTKNAPEKPVVRYKLSFKDKDGKVKKGFDYRISLREPDVTIRGTMFIEISVFFRRTASVSYRLVIDDIDGFSKTGEDDGSDFTGITGLDTDHIIMLASLKMGAEHWQYEQLAGEASPRAIIDRPDISIDSYLGDNCNWLAKPERLQAKDEERCIRCINENGIDILSDRFKKFILKKKDTEKVREDNYVYIDVWEDIDNSLHTFRAMNDAEKIVSHIRSDFKRELIGLMSLYPGEWRYRDPLAFDEVCGPNIAIDTDDFVLANEKISVVFGVYGIRGEADIINDAEVKWKEHLAHVRKRYNVSWAEYLLILEMALARRSTITAALDYFVNKTKLDEDPDNISVDDIKENAKMSLKVTRMNQAMNAVQYARFISHKVMLEKVLCRIGMEKQSCLLDETISKIDASLKNIREMNNWRKSGRINTMVMLLSLLSGLSLVTILFQELDIKILSANPEYADSSRSVAIVVVMVCTVLIVTAIVWILAQFGREVLGWCKRKKRFKKKD